MNRPSPSSPSTPDGPQPWAHRLLIGAGFGAGFGALHSMYYEHWLVSLLAGMASGASFYSLIGLLYCYTEERSFKTILLGAFAGCISGIMWWLIVRPPTPLLLSASLTAVVGVFVIWWKLDP